MLLQAVGDVFQRGRASRPSFHSPPCLSIGRGQALGAVQRLVGEAVACRQIQHSLTASFSSGSTRMTLLLLTWTIRFAPRRVVRADADLRRDSSQVRAL